MYSFAISLIATRYNIVLGEAKSLVVIDDKYESFKYLRHMIAIDNFLTSGSCFWAAFTNPYYISMGILLLYQTRVSNAAR